MARSGSFLEWLRVRGAARRGTASLAIVASSAAGILFWTTVVVTGPRTAIFLQDWIVYYAAGTAARDGALALLYDGQRFTDFQAAQFARWIAGPIDLHPWLYPPHYLLLLAPLSRLPLVLSYAGFVLVTGLGAAASMAWPAAGARFQWPRAIVLLLSPATAIGALTGQNALLSTALLIGGMRLLARRPVAAGAVLALLTYKPQLFLLVPVALVAAREWRALTALAITAALLVAASAAIFGPAAWLLWLDQVVLARDPAYATWYAETFLRGYSLYVAAALSGAPAAIASTVQALAVGGAAAATWWAWRRAVAFEARLAVLLAATMLAAPHLQAYDMVILAAAAILLFAAREDGIGLGALALFAGVWVLPYFRPFTVPSGRYVIPVVLIGMLAMAVGSARYATRQRWQSTPPVAPPARPSGMRNSR